MFQDALREIVDGVEGGVAGLIMDSRASPSRATRATARRSTSPPSASSSASSSASIKRAAEMLEAGHGARGRHRHREDDHAHPDAGRHVLPRVRDDARRQPRQGALHACAPPRPKLLAELPEAARGRGAPRPLHLRARTSSCLGTREPEVYGTRDARRHPRAPRGARARARRRGRRAADRTTRATLVDWIGAARADGFAGVLLNAGRLHAHVDRDPRRAQGRRAPVRRGAPLEPRRARAVPPPLAHRPACVGRVAGFGRAQLRARASRASSGTSRA